MSLESISTNLAIIAAILTICGVLMQLAQSPAQAPVSIHIHTTVDHRKESPHWGSLYGSTPGRYTPSVQNPKSIWSPGSCTSNDASLPWDGSIRAGFDDDIAETP